MQYNANRDLLRREYEGKKTPTLNYYHHQVHEKQINSKLVSETAAPLGKVKDFTSIELQAAFHLALYRWKANDRLWSELSERGIFLINILSSSQASAILNTLHQRGIPLSGYQLTLATKLTLKLKSSLHIMCLSDIARSTRAISALFPRSGLAGEFLFEVLTTCGASHMDPKNYVKNETTFGSKNAPEHFAGDSACLRGLARSMWMRDWARIANSVHDFVCNDDSGTVQNDLLTLLQEIAARTPSPVSELITDLQDLSMELNNIKMKKMKNRSQEIQQSNKSTSTPTMNISTRLFDMDLLDGDRESEDLSSASLQNGHVLLSPKIIAAWVRANVNSDDLLLAITQYLEVTTPLSSKKWKEWKNAKKGHSQSKDNRIVKKNRSHLKLLTVNDLMELVHKEGLVQYWSPNASSNSPTSDNVHNQTSVSSWRWDLDDLTTVVEGLRRMRIYDGELSHRWLDAARANLHMYKNDLGHCIKIVTMALNLGIFHRHFGRRLNQSLYTALKSNKMNMISNTTSSKLKAQTLLEISNILTKLRANDSMYARRAYWDIVHRILTSQIVKAESMPAISVLESANPQLFPQLVGLIPTGPTVESSCVTASLSDHSEEEKDAKAPSAVNGDTLLPSTSNSIVSHRLIDEMSLKIPNSLKRGGDSHDLVVLHRELTSIGNSNVLAISRVPFRFVEATYPSQSLPIEMLGEILANNLILFGTESCPGSLNATMELLLNNAQKGTSSIAILGCIDTLERLLRLHFVLEKNSTTSINIQRQSEELAKLINMLWKRRFSYCEDRLQELIIWSRIISLKFNNHEKVGSWASLVDLNIHKDRIVKLMEEVCSTVQRKGTFAADVSNILFYLSHVYVNEPCESWETCISFALEAWTQAVNESQTHLNPQSLITGIRALCQLAKYKPLDSNLQDIITISVKDIETPLNSIMFSLNINEILAMITSVTIAQNYTNSIALQNIKHHLMAKILSKENQLRPKLHQISPIIAGLSLCGFLNALQQCDLTLAETLLWEEAVFPSGWISRRITVGNQCYQDHTPFSKSDLARKLESNSLNAELDSNVWKLLEKIHHVVQIEATQNALSLKQPSDNVSRVKHALLTQSKIGELGIYSSTKPLMEQ